MTRRLFLERGPGTKTWRKIERPGLELPRLWSYYFEHSRLWTLHKTASMLEQSVTRVSPLNSEAGDQMSSRLGIYKQLPVCTSKQKWQQKQGKEPGFVSCQQWWQEQSRQEPRRANLCLSKRSTGHICPILGAKEILPMRRKAPWGSERSAHHPRIGNAKGPNRSMASNTPWKKVVHGCWDSPKAGHVWEKKPDNWPKVTKDWKEMI